jgi:hypothetical protein
MSLSIGPTCTRAIPSSSMIPRLPSRSRRTRPNRTDGGSLAAMGQNSGAAYFAGVRVKDQRRTRCARRCSVVGPSWRSLSRNGEPLLVAVCRGCGRRGVIDPGGQSNCPWHISRIHLLSYGRDYYAGASPGWGIATGRPRGFDYSGAGGCHGETKLARGGVVSARTPMRKTACGLHDAGWKRAKQRRLVQKPMSVWLKG